ncbi:YybH family protein [Marinactinospora rubrisoli]|uniref:YybH family protein n=1 Tax=Marinactinospora rubrisoli TaxID=2715399 RepID=A0ABW2KAD4_9ACTN
MPPEPDALPERPEDVPAAFAARFNSGDVTRVLEMYEPDAVLIPESGTPAAGAALRTALSRHLALGLPIEVRARHVYRTGGTALLIVDWRIHGTGPDGAGVALTGTATDVVRRGGDGVWRYAVDNPFGTAA